MSRTADLTPEQREQQLAHLLGQITELIPIGILALGVREWSRNEQGATLAHTCIVAAATGEGQSYPEPDGSRWTRDSMNRLVRHGWPPERR